MLNPFKPLEYEHELLGAARAGVFTAGWIAFSYLLTTTVMILTAGGPSGPPLPAGGYVVPVVATALVITVAALLGWRIWVAQPLWASVIVLNWLALEMIMTAMAGRFGILGLAIGAIGIACGILSIRGAHGLRQMRRSAPTVNPTTFD